MNKTYIFLIITLILMACTNSHDSKMYDELEKADSLLTKELPDSAYKELLTIGQPPKNDKKSKAYHALLVTQARYLLYMSTDSCADIDYAIEYYKETEDKEKLARALHWKAGLLREAGRYLEAIEAEKGAEANLSENTNPMLRIRIYDIMSWLNEQTGNYPQAKEYAIKALSLAEKLKNKERIANAHYGISSAYTHLEQVDSALYHIEKALPFIDYTPLKSPIILQVALCYRNTGQWAKAEEYVKKGMVISSNKKYESLLGDIYIHTGRANDGVAILQKVLPELEGTAKWHAMQLIEDVMMKHGKHAEAARLQEEISLLKDSIAKERQTTEALAVQKEYELKAKQEKAKENNGTSWIKYTIMGGACAIIAAIIFLVWYRKKLKKKHDREMMKAIKENERKQEQIACLNEKLGKNRQKTAEAVIRGKMLYDRICNNENTHITSSSDYADIVEYYRTIKPSFFAEKEQKYEGLTPYNLSILMFKEEMQLSDESIAEICGITAGALRTQRSRIKSKMLVPEE